ncbi:MAG: AMP-binding protein, partial [Dermatophilaceae bacterium]
MTFNLASILKDSVRRDPDHPAVVSDAGTLTYAQLEAMSDAVACGLIEAGVRPGDVVGLQLPNIPEFPIALHGILKAGATVVPMNT